MQAYAALRKRNDKPSITLQGTGLFFLFVVIIGSFPIRLPKMFLDTTIALLLLYDKCSKAEKGMILQYQFTFTPRKEAANSHLMIENR